MEGALKKLLIVCSFLGLTSCATPMQQQANKEVDAWKLAGDIITSRCLNGDSDYTPKPSEALKTNKCVQKVVNEKVMPVAVFPDLLMKMSADALESAEAYAKGNISQAKYRADAMRRWADYLRTSDAAIQSDAAIRQQKLSQSLQQMSDNIQAQQAEQQRQLNERLLIQSLSQPRSVTMDCYTYGNYTRCN